MTDNILLQMCIYLGAAILFVPLAKKLGMGSVLGYLLAGIIIGPSVLGLIGHEGQDIIHFAEFGIVMMLFLIGLELEPVHFWRMKNFIFGLGSLQVALTGLLLYILLIMKGFSWQAALACGLALAMSSTAFVLQSLKEKGLSATQAGQSSFSVLLFQDISIIPILAMLPFLAVKNVHAVIHNHTPGLTGWLQAGSVLFAVLLVVVAGRYIIVPLLRFVAQTQVRELCTASALFIVAIIAYLMQLVGLSPALGTFLAGVVLANSEFRHELESDIEPFKGLLLGLFFMTVGAAINFKLILTNPVQIVSLVIAIMVIKIIVLLIIGRIFKLSFNQNLIFAFGLSQVGEFAFVLFSFIAKLDILSKIYIDTFMAITALSMGLTPLFMLLIEKLFTPYRVAREGTEKPADLIQQTHPVIIAGFGYFGSNIGRFLRANGIEAIILDNDSDRVELLRKMGFKVYYGDATRMDMLKSAGADSARILIATLSDPDINFSFCEKVKKHFPGLTLMVRAKDSGDAYDLMDLGITDIYRSSLDTSVKLGVDVLVKLGFRKYSALRAGQNFIKYDQASLDTLARHRHDHKSYIHNAREQILQQEQLLTNDRLVNPTINDHAWDSIPEINPNS